ncbi:MAG: HAMP domain-containing sensor histidine kinase [Sulfurovum sp.]|nr:HAMP domain-containing sensor histidine kinase [Sulfurovum sp.]MDD3601836.1 HAMP domain-containing sensor histidine kinase [Sulfurovum sp.]
MYKRVWMATSVYVLSLIGSMALMYFFMQERGFSKENFLIISGVVLMFAWGIGHIISSYLLAPQATIDTNLSELVNEVVHELNLPLSTITANTAMLKKQTDDLKFLKRLERIEAAAYRLERLYKELVYGIKKELHPVAKEMIALEKLLQERVEVFEAFERNPFKRQLEACRIYADKIGFEKMIDNLLANAMKYSPKDKPIRLILKEKILTIADEGMGMDETQLVRVFERYYQGDKQQDGEGIGLALVKTYCDTEGIGIQVHSQKTKGTKVILNLSKIVYK